MRINAMRAVFLTISNWKVLAFGSIILVSFTYFARHEHPIEEDVKVILARQKVKSALASDELITALKNLDYDPIEIADEEEIRGFSIEVTKKKGNFSHRQIKTRVNESCDCRYENLRKNILEFLTRDTWWDASLCSEKFGKIGAHISDLIPLQTLNKDIWTNKDHFKNIYFIETNCKPTIQFYVLCALESAAKMNSEAMVFLLTAIPFLEDKSKVIRRLLNKYPNVRITQIDYDDILQGTPLDGFRSEGVWTKNEDYLRAHMSDIARTALIWKEGGTYMDTDIISVKSQPNVENAVVTGLNDIFNGVIRAKKHHAYLKTVMNHQKSNYDKNSYNCVGLISTTVGATLYCGITTFKPGMCKDMNILPVESFTSVLWKEAEIIISPHSTKNMTEFLATSFGVHTSHHILQEKLNTVQNDSMYDKMTKEFCPLSYKIVKQI